MTSAGRPPAWLARVAVVALLVGAVFPLLALAFSPPDAEHPSNTPALAALSSALEKAQRCLQGDGRTALDPVAPSVLPCTEAGSAIAAPVSPSPAPAAPWTPPDAVVGPVETSRQL
jgi:hypothetical protein